jgi:hypothetical protein
MDTIRDKLRRQITRSTLLFIPVGVGAFVVGTFGWIRLKPQLAISAEGWSAIAAGVVYLVWLIRLSRFPCPKCGYDLWMRNRVPHTCPACGLSLDTPYEDLGAPPNNRWRGP